MVRQDLVAFSPFLSALLCSFPLAFISSWELEMTHNLETLLLANHSGKHLKMHTYTFPAQGKISELFCGGEIDPKLLFDRGDF